MKPKTYHCKACDLGGMTAPQAIRHLNLTHRADTQPRCTVCGEIGSTWATRHKKTARCRRHALRYGICRWCGASLDRGYGQPGALCRCVASGVIPQGAAA